MALSVATAYLFSHPGRQIPTSAVPQSAQVTVRVRQESSADLPPTVVYVTNRFQWRAIESDDYEKYIGNLRAIGCPEKTIRDIILADVNKLYAARRRAWAAKGPFWLAGKERRKAEYAREREMNALNQEQVALIRRLLGIECYPDYRQEFDKFVEQALLRFFWGPMPGESLRRGFGVLAKYDSLRHEVNERCRGVLLEEDNAQLEALYQQMCREFEAFLTPLEWEEMTARMSACMFSMKDFNLIREFKGVDITPAELRQIALAAAVDAKLFDWPWTGTDAEREAQQKQFYARVKDILGEIRYQDFERAHDDDFQTLFDIGKNHGLPKETAIKIFELRKLAKEEAARIRQNPSLDEFDRNQQLREIQAAVRQEVSGALGTGALLDYLGRGAEWLTNLNKL